MTLEEQLASALRDARQQNARRINRLRAIGIGAFTATIALMVFGLRLESWRTELGLTALYFVIALAIMLAGERSPRVLRASRYVVPVIDMPMVFIIQFFNILTEEDRSGAGNISEFSLALFVCLLMLSAFTLNTNRIFLSLLLAILFEQILQHAAGIQFGGRVLSAVVLCFATWICAFAGRNRLHMVETITEADARRRRLQRYFSPGVGEILEEQEEDDLAQGQECELTVLFTDIRGFTALSEQLSTDEIIQVLNTYHAHMVEAVFQHGGTLDKYLGDGLMAYFNAPVGQPDHAERAVQCALTMQRELVALNRSRSWHDDLELRIGIGIHTDRAIVGDIGAPHRREFTAIGQAVNIASRLEAMTKEQDVNILVSQATARLVPSGVAWREVGEFPVRGCAQPLHLLSPGQL